MALVPSTSVGSGGSGASTQIFDSTAGGAVASLDATGIAGTYNHLQVIVAARSDQAGAQVLSVRLNGDTGANYYGVSLNVANTASVGEIIAATAMRVGSIPGTGGTAGFVGICQFIIPIYAGTTFKKAILSSGGRDDGLVTTTLNYEGAQGSWNNTAAVTQVTVLANAGNLIAGSRMTIYGLT